MSEQAQDGFCTCGGSQGDPREARTCGIRVHRQSAAARLIRERLYDPSTPAVSRVQWEVWGDGEDLRHGIDRVDDAIAYAARLSDEWHSVEIVRVHRMVTRVR